MNKPLKPTDGRLKANRALRQFMQRAVYEPSVRRANGDPAFALVEADDEDNTPDPRELRGARAAWGLFVHHLARAGAEESVFGAARIQDLANEDLLLALMLELVNTHGASALSRAGSIVAHLQSRAQRQGWGGSGGKRSDAGEKGLAAGDSGI
jgi:hypothetical protein